MLQPEDRDKEQRHPPNGHRSKSSCGHPRADTVPHPSASPGHDVHFTSCAGKLLPPVMKIWGLLHSKRKTRTAQQVESTFGLLSEGEKLKY